MIKILITRDERARSPDASLPRHADVLTSGSLLIEERRLQRDIGFEQLETGQPAFALAASCSNVAWSAPGIFAFSVSWTAVMA